MPLRKFRYLPESQDPLESQDDTRVLPRLRRFGGSLMRTNQSKCEEEG